jgi:hypothetical protein
LSSSCLYIDKIIRITRNFDDFKGINARKLTTHLLKPSAGLKTVNPLPDPSVVDLSIAVGKACSGKSTLFDYCCDTDDLWPHRRITIIMGARKNIDRKKIKGSDDVKD